MAYIAHYASRYLENATIIKHSEERNEEEKRNKQWQNDHHHEKHA